MKKANRDLSQLLSSLDPSISKIDVLQRKYSELLAEMKRTEREHNKAKKRADLLQKEKDTLRSELNKSNSIKEKLEKLSRELTKENKKMKVGLARIGTVRTVTLTPGRTTCATQKRAPRIKTRSYTAGSKRWSRTCPWSRATLRGASGRPKI